MVNNWAVSLDAIKNKEFSEIIKQMILEQNCNNNYSSTFNIKASDRYICNLKKEMCLHDRISKIKSLSRNAAFSNIRNNISLCALSKVLSECVDPELILSQLMMFQFY